LRRAAVILNIVSAQGVKALRKRSNPCRFLVNGLGQFGGQAFAVQDGPGRFSLV
jgi:hypothetical protein